MEHNGRVPIDYNGVEYITQKMAAQRLDIGLMSLRRNAVLSSALGMIKLNGHAYYRKYKVEMVIDALEGYKQRKQMKNPPRKTADRIAMRETLIYGILCYPINGKSNKGENQ